MTDTGEKIKFTSSRFGEIEIPEKDLIHVPEGIIGFQHLTRFALLDTSGGESQFLWLQAVDEPKLAFIITDPLIFVPGYGIDMSEPDLARIGAMQKSPPALFAIVTVPQDNPDSISANLLAPLIFFEKESLMYQVVLEKGNWPIRCPLLEYVPEAGKASNAGGAEPC